MDSMSTVKRRTGWLPRAALAILVCVFSLASVAQTSRIPLPDMGNSASTVLSDKEEADYAKALLRQMRAYEVLVEDPQLVAYFADMGFKLVAHSDRPDKSFTFVILDEPNVNAFAAPGGIIALHSGLILSAENEHEVAGVLAHEIAHITQLHLYRAFEKARSMSLPLALAMLGMILAGGGGGDVMAGAVMSGNAMAQQMQINFTRHNEIEADRIGIRTLALAGYDPEAMASFFSKLNRLTRANGEGPPEFLRTHPVTVNRIAEAMNRAETMPRPEPTDGLDFYLMQARMRAMVEDKPKDAIAWFREALDKDYPVLRERALKYGLAIALQRDRQYREAEDLLWELIRSDPGLLTYQLQIAALDLERGDHDAAASRLGGLYHSFPGNHAIAMQYSGALLQSEDPQQAETAAIILRQQILYRSEDPALFEQYAKAANLAGDHVRATEAIAESYYQRGGVQEALEQLERLSKDDGLDYYERSRVSARLMELRIEMGEARGEQRKG